VFEHDRASLWPRHVQITLLVTVQAILVYWVSTNFISLLQVGFLRIPAVRDFFRIEKMVTHTPDSLPVKPKGFVKGLQDCK